KHGVKITNTVVGAPDGSIGGGLTDPAHRKQWLKRTAMTLAFNREAKIPATIVCTGNVVPGRSDRQMEASVLKGLEATLRLAEDAGITLLLEPLNTGCDHPGYWLTSSDRSADICRKFDSPRLRLLFDCYHMQVMEGDLIKHVERNLDLIGHIHSAGVPVRHELFRRRDRLPVSDGRNLAHGISWRVRVGVHAQHEPHGLVAQDTRLPGQEIVGVPSMKTHRPIHPIGCPWLSGMALLGAMLAQQAAAETYYLDADNGSDSHLGTSPEKPWKSLEKVNATVVAPGDRLLLKAGTSYAGTLKLQGSGREGAVIVVDMYGEGAKPSIDAQGKHDEALLLRNVEYWEVNNLALANKGEERAPFRASVRLVVDDFGTRSTAFTITSSTPRAN
ncbi:MAG: TIM barrel protein, partial [Patescibacteria group bacterium]|nr:TIM barrel protein [Patescibacteria group bacterium]